MESHPVAGIIIYALSPGLRERKQAAAAFISLCFLAVEPETKRLGLPFHAGLYVQTMFPSFLS